MDHFSGLDVSLRSCALCVVDGNGKVTVEDETACEASEIAAYIGEGFVSGVRDEMDMSSKSSKL